MATSGASKGAKKVGIWNEGNTKDLNIAKTPSQEAKSDSLKSIKRLTREGKHLDAQALYNETFKL